MKRISVVLFVLIMGMQSKAQHVSVRLNFPGGPLYRPVATAPVRGSVWIGPEWRWDRGRYVAVPGYWARPRRHHSVWIPGYWQSTRWGYRWIPGRWG